MLVDLCRISHLRSENLKKNRLRRAITAYNFYRILHLRSTNLKKKIACGGPLQHTLCHVFFSVSNINQILILRGSSTLNRGAPLQKETAPCGLPLRWWGNTTIPSLSPISRMVGRGGAKRGSLVEGTPKHIAENLVYFPLLHRRRRVKNHCVVARRRRKIWPFGKYFWRKNTLLSPQIWGVWGDNFPYPPKSEGYGGIIQNLYPPSLGG